MKKKKTTAEELSKMFGISHGRSVEAIMKAQIISAILKVMEQDELTHAQIALKSKLPRSAVTGILSGSLQKVTIDRLLRMAEAVGLKAQITLKRSA
ncbi:XRE family transcriptional regulator [Bdellovibrio reynosensis]|uniref:Helix-turn-helix domain-containing protein n=1 Tax=Bdellovibrio reynosensis TaxID=2835041 RepID=A0ABY4CCQ0_9BACT|nr:XRE family transcriptional regulator [Bdellovibrio reynosensis]UOF02219.1 helix-turn-helix domain-containing protein [Bdellovibrio reynosensis]